MLKDIRGYMQDICQKKNPTIQDELRGYKTDVFYFEAVTVL
jgi:hypothetical protein